MDHLKIGEFDSSSDLRLFGSTRYTEEAKSGKVMHIFHVKLNADKSLNTDPSTVVVKELQLNDAAFVLSIDKAVDGDYFHILVFYKSVYYVKYNYKDDTSFKVNSVYKSNRFEGLIMTESFFVPQNSIGTATTGTVTEFVADGRRSYSVGYSKKVKHKSTGDVFKNSAGDSFMGILVPSLRQTESCIDYSEEEKEKTISIAD